MLYGLKIRTWEEAASIEYPFFQHELFVDSTYVSVWMLCHLSDVSVYSHSQSMPDNLPLLLLPAALSVTISVFFKQPNIMLLAETFFFFFLWKKERIVLEVATAERNFKKKKKKKAFDEEKTVI